MENKDLPAFPTLWQTAHNPDWQNDGGLTKREYFAVMALQGYTSAGSTGMPEPHQLIALAVSAADALLVELSKPQP